jgi:DinB superfamily
MHPRISELLEYIDRQAANLEAAYTAIPAERRTVRPAPDRWSPAEVVHHVAIVERRLVTRLRQLADQARAFPPEQDASSVFTIVDAKRIEIRNNRFKTSELGEPRDTDASRVWSEFETTRRELKDVVRSADGLALNEVSAPHPALGPLTGYGWIAFAGAHAARHAAQITEDASPA